MDGHRADDPGRLHRPAGSRRPGGAGARIKRPAGEADHADRGGGRTYRADRGSPRSSAGGRSASSAPPRKRRCGVALPPSATPRRRRSRRGRLTMNPQVMTERRATLIGALLNAIGGMSMSLYTPAMPALVTCFATTIPTIKLSLTLYFAGFTPRPAHRRAAFRRLWTAAGGARLPLAIPSRREPHGDGGAEHRLAPREGCYGASAPRRGGDLAKRSSATAHQAKSARIMNAIGLIMAVGPALSPTIGGTILSLLGWHAIFVFWPPTASSSWRPIAATMPRRRRAATRRASIHPAWSRTTRRSPPIRLPAAGDRHRLHDPGTLYASATMLPFVLIGKVGLSPVAFGIGMLAQSGSYIAGSVATRVLMRRVSARRWCRMASSSPSPTRCCSPCSSGSLRRPMSRSWARSA